MRKVIDEQLLFGEVDVSQIEFDPKSRDDIPQLLKGLQYIYTNVDSRKKVFDVLEKAIPKSVNKKNGRPGMELWKILVLGTLRLNLNLDYDRLTELANQHNNIRKMLGHGVFNNSSYHLQTIKDNIKLLTPEILEEINVIIVEAGHRLLKKKIKN